MRALVLVVPSVMLIFGCALLLPLALSEEAVFGGALIGTWVEVVEEAEHPAPTVLNVQRRDGTGEDLLQADVVLPPSDSATRIHLEDYSVLVNGVDF